VHDTYYFSFLAALYYSLGNIKPKNRSHLNAIQLLGLLPSRHFKTYGIDPLLEAFMEDLSKLEQVCITVLPKRFSY
jgi:hypothetical protein